MNERNDIPVKKYEQVRNHLLHLLKSREFEAGHFVGSEQDLVEELGLSRNTVRRAIGDLVQEGILYRKRGQGTFFAGFENDAQTSGIIGMVTHTITDNIYPEIIQGMEDYAHDQGYNVALSSTSSDRQKEVDTLRQMNARSIEGLIIEPAFSALLTRNSDIVTTLAEMDVPVVLTNCRFSFMPYSAVTIDDIELGYRAAAYLIEKGHRTIAFMYFQSAMAATDRAEGITRAFRDYGLGDENCIMLPYTTEEDQRPAFGETLAFLDNLSKREDLPDAIVYYNDQSALSAYPAFKHKGLLIGKDVSVMGFDDIDSTQLVDPPLTTWKHPKYQMGLWAAQLLFEEIENQSDGRIPRTVLGRPPLIERDSVRDLT